MAFATPEDVATRLGRELTATEAATVALLIEAATSLVASAGAQTDTWATELDPVPSALRTVTVEAVHRVLVNPTGASSVMEQLGAHQHAETWRDGSTGLTLTTGERRLVRRALGFAFTSVTLESPFSGPVDDDPSL